MPALTRRSLLAGITAATSLRALAPAFAQHAPAPEQLNTLLAYLRLTAPNLLRPAEGILARPSIAPALPGKQYSTNLWDWDTLWTTRGLLRFSTLTRDTAFQAQILTHAQGSLLNFLDHQSPNGRLPILLTPTSADPLGTLIKGDAASHNQAKPIFAQLALLIADHQNSTDWVTPHFDKILSFYVSWSPNLTSIGLYVWGNDVAIGDDNDPTTFGRPDFSSANLLLNCLFYQDLRAAADLATRLHRPQDSAHLSTQARSLASAIQKHCWDPRDQFFYTADVQCVDRRTTLIPSVTPGMAMSWHSLPLRIQMFTGFLPLWCGIATPQQAQQLVSTSYLADDRFRCSSGVRSLSSRESMYSLAFSSNPSNWLGPTWIIVNYLVWKGLKDYGFTREASDLAAKTLRLLTDDLTQSHSMNEYYHPDTGAPLSHPGFMDWNLLVLEMIQPE